MAEHYINTREARQKWLADRYNILLEISYRLLLKGNMMRVRILLGCLSKSRIMMKSVV